MTMCSTLSRYKRSLRGDGDEVSNDGDRGARPDDLDGMREGIGSGAARTRVGRPFRHEPDHRVGLPGARTDPPHRHQDIALANVRRARERPSVIAKAFS